MTIWTPHIAGRAGPRYMALADALQDDIASGGLRPGDRLPTHRDLAETLGVTVGTVSRGYKEAARRGLTSGETGRGTFVAGRDDGQSPLSVAETVPQRTIDLGFTPPLSALDPDLGQTLRDIAGRKDIQNLLRYQPAKGRMRDRETGSLWAERHNLGVHPENVLLCCGGQHALLTVLMALFRPGERIATDAITYPLFKTLAMRLGLTLLPIPGDQGGMIPGELDEACRKHPISGLYLMPSRQNPTTTVLSDARRREIAGLAAKRDLKIIEDDAYAVIGGEPATPLFRMAPDRTFFVAGLSKALAGALRVSFLYAPAEYVPRLARAVADSVWMAPPLMAEIARQWIDDGTADAVIAKKRAEAAARNVLAADILHGHNLRQGQTSLFAWLLLPDPWSGPELERQAADRGVVVIPDERFLIGQTPPPHAARLSLSCPDSREGLRKGLEIIRDILK